MADPYFDEAVKRGWEYIALNAKGALSKHAYVESLKRAAPPLRQQGQDRALPIPSHPDIPVQADECEYIEKGGEPPFEPFPPEREANRRDFKRPDPSTVAWVMAAAVVVALLIYIQSQLP